MRILLIWTVLGQVVIAEVGKAGRRAFRCWLIKKQPLSGLCLFRGPLGHGRKNTGGILGGAGLMMGVSSAMDIRRTVTWIVSPDRASECLQRKGDKCHGEKYEQQVKADKHSLKKCWVRRG